MHRIAYIVFLLLLTGCGRCRYGCENGLCNRGTCDCFEWYEGDACERSILKAYEGDHGGELIRADTIIDTLSFQLQWAQNPPEEMLLEGEELTIRFTDRWKFDLPDQPWKNYQVSGEGEMLLDRLSMRMELRTDSMQSEASVSAQRQL
jgi:hypothetical protein